MTAAPSKLDQILEYAARGWAVFPAWWPLTDGSCACGKADCGSVGKHPMTEHGFLDASTDGEQIRRWWNEKPYANVGIATGAVSGFVALDIDPDHGGDDALRELEGRFEPVPETPRTLTGGGGVHYLFAHPGHHVGNATGGQTPGWPRGVDFRGDGGYIIAPPSVHAARRRYQWDLAAHPDDIPFATLPGWIDRLNRRQGEGHASVAVGDAPALPDRILKGARNAWLASIAGTLRRRGLEAHEIAYVLSGLNTGRCDPPLSDREVQSIADSVGRYDPADVPETADLETAPPPERPADVLPFPIDVLPAPLRAFAIEVARDLDSVPEIVALPALAYASGAIGRTRRIRLTARYSESALLWSGLVGDPGSGKTPAIGYAGEFLRERDAQMIEQWQREMDDYKWRLQTRTKGQDPPEKPARRRRVVQDSTIEALAAILAEDPHGVVMDHDELGAWIGSFDQYRSKGAGADRARWLSIWSGHDIRVDRRMREETLIVRRPFVSVCGTIQPEMLKTLASEIGNDGFLARFCFAYVPRMPAVALHESTVPAGVVAEWEGAIAGLLSLDGYDVPEVFTHDGKRAFIAGSAMWARTQNSPELDPRMRGFYAKGIGTAGRLCLIDYLLREAAGEIEEPGIGPESAEAAWALMSYFASTMQYVVLRVAETAIDRTVEEVVEYTRQHGGTLVLRDAQRAQVAGIRSASELKDAFKAVQDHGLGTVTREPVAGGERWTLTVP